MHWYQEFLILGWMLNETLHWILVMKCQIARYWRCAKDNRIASVLYSFTEPKSPFLSKS